MNKFCTIINCIDGRFQDSVARFVKKKFSAKFADTITGPGVSRILVDQTNQAILDYFFECIKTSVVTHKSSQIAIAAHEDCVGNPAEKASQIKQLKQSATWIWSKFPHINILLLWIDRDKNIVEVPFTESLF